MSDSSTYPTQKGISGIYEIFCKANGSQYIGSTTCLSRRKKTHLELLKGGRHENNHLQNAFDLYGADSFDFHVIEFCDSNFLLEREQYYLDTMHPKFNIALYASSPMKGRNHTFEVIQGIASKLTGRKFTEEHKRKIGESNLGKKRTDEHKTNISIGTIKHAPKGKDHPNAKFAQVDIERIMDLHSQGISNNRISKVFNVDHSTIDRIVSGRTYKKHVS